MRRVPSRRPPVPHTPAHRRSESPLPPSSPDNRRPLSERPHPSDITRILFIGEIADKRLSKIFVEIFPPPEKIFLHLSALSPIMSNQEDPNHAQIPPHPTASLPLCDGNGQSVRPSPAASSTSGSNPSQGSRSSCRRPTRSMSTPWRATSKGGSPSHPASVPTDCCSSISATTR